MPSALLSCSHLARSIIINHHHHQSSSIPCAEMGKGSNCRNKSFCRDHPCLQHSVVETLKPENTIKNKNNLVILLCQTALLTVQQGDQAFNTHYPGTTGAIALPIHRGHLPLITDLELDNAQSRARVDGHCITIDFGLLDAAPCRQDQTNFNAGWGCRCMEKDKVPRPQPLEKIGATNSYKFKQNNAGNQGFRMFWMVLDGFGWLW